MSRPPLPSPVHISQLDGSPWAGQGCMGAAGAMALDAYTGGAIRVGMADIRRNQDDQSGGIGLDDVAQAWRRGWKLSFAHGPYSWATVMGRLRMGLGCVVTVRYGAMGRHRAPGSDFTGAHALYLQRTTGLYSGNDQLAVVVDDPLRRSAVTLPASVLQLAYTGGAGWGAGTYAAAGGGAGAGAGAKRGAVYRAGSPLVSYPRGATDWTADAIIAKLHAAAYFGAALDPAAAIAEDVARGVLRADQGRPWTEALHREWAGELGSAAVTAGDPAAALGALAGALVDLPTTLARGGIVAGLVALAIVGVVLTFREPLAVALPSPVRGLTR